MDEKVVADSFDGRTLGGDFVLQLPMSEQLQNIGIHCIADLRGKDPEELYRLDCMKKGFRDDRCVLYVFRCAVYFAEHEQHEPEKLKWWYWKDKDYPERCENQL